MTAVSHNDTYTHTRRNPPLSNKQTNKQTSKTTCCTDKEREQRTRGVPGATGISCGGATRRRNTGLLSLMTPRAECGSKKILVFVYKQKTNKQKTISTTGQKSNANNKTIKRSEQMDKQKSTANNKNNNSVYLRRLKYVLTAPADNVTVMAC